jgi:hypothetical protein
MEARASRQLVAELLHHEGVQAFDVVPEAIVDLDALYQVAHTECVSLYKRAASDRAGCAGLANCVMTRIPRHI